MDVILILQESFNDFIILLNILTLEFKEAVIQLWNIHIAIFLSLKISCNWIWKLL